MPEIFNPRNPPPNPLDSKAGLRGAICGFISKRKKVTHRELHQEFGAYELDEALTGLFDRQYLDYRQGPDGGTYFLNPAPPARQPPAVRERLNGSRSKLRKRKPAYDPNDPERLFHHFQRIARDSTKSDLERFRARMDCLDIIRYLGYWPDPIS